MLEDFVVKQFAVSTENYQDITIEINNSTLNFTYHKDTKLKEFLIVNDEFIFNNEIYNYSQDGKTVFYKQNSKYYIGVK